MKLLSVENAKTTKGESLGYLTGILFLAPHTLGDGKTNLCPGSTPGCRASCLFSAGRGRLASVYNARIRKTRELINDYAGFVDRLAADIHALQAKADRLGLTPAVRLNGTSDIDWENQKGSQGWTLMELFPWIQFYDYTKIARRAVASRSAEGWPTNYHLTFSASESLSTRVAGILERASVNIARVYPSLPIGAFDGTAHDLRFLDPIGVEVALVAKGDAKKDNTGFVSRT